MAIVITASILGLILNLIEGQGACPYGIHGGCPSGQYTVPGGVEYGIFGAILRVLIFTHHFLFTVPVHTPLLIMNRTMWHSWRSFTVFISSSLPSSLQAKMIIEEE